VELGQTRNEIRDEAERRPASKKAAVTERGEAACLGGGVELWKLAA
jgi:hypothetical protein